MAKSNNIFFLALRHSNEYVNKRFKSMLLALLWIHEIKKRSKLFKNGMQNEVDRPTRLLQFVAFVHLPFSFRSLDLFVASLLFMKGTSFYVVRRKWSY